VINALSVGNLISASAEPFRHLPTRVSGPRPDSEGG